MIANRGPVKRRAQSGSLSFAQANAYATRTGELKPGQRPVIASWCENVVSVETAGLEMQRVAGASRSKDRLYHLTVSWAPGERPSVSEAQAALDVYTDRLGFRGLQVVAALQNDGKEAAKDGREGSAHVHAIYNLVDPERGTVRSTWRDKTHMREASREVEFEQGWASGAKRERSRELIQERNEPKREANGFWAAVMERVDSWNERERERRMKTQERSL